MSACCNLLSLIEALYRSQNGRYPWVFSDSTGLIITTHEYLDLTNGLTDVTRRSSPSGRVSGWGSPSVTSWGFWNDSVLAVKG